MVQNTAAPVARLVREAQQHHMAGRMREAEQLYRRVLASDPRNPEATAGLGLVAAQVGNLPAARDLLVKALAVQPDNPDNLVNLAKVDIGLKRVGEAQEALEQALAKRRRDAVAWNLLGWCQQHQGALDQAVDSFRQAVRLKSDFAEALNNLGSALMLQGRNDEAAKILTRCVTAVPKAAQPHMNLGSVLSALGRHAEATRHATRAAELAPQAGETWFNLGRVHHAAGALKEAADAYRKAVELVPGNAMFMNNLALVLDGLLETDEALEWAEKAAAAAPKVGEFHENLVRAHVAREDLAAAKRVAEEGLAAAPGHAGMRLLLADIAAREGRFSDARGIYEMLLEEDPENARALRGLARSGKMTADDPVIGRMATLVERPDLSLDDRVELHFALGKAADDAGNPEEAFRFYAAGNALRNGQMGYDARGMEEYVDAVIAAFTPERMAEPAVAQASDLPVMILGMPRSGTTLVEQIVSNHAAVMGGGELPDLFHVEHILQRRHGYPAAEALTAEALAPWTARYLEHLRRIAARAEDPAAVARVTDKLPSNAFRLGLIARMLPGTRVLHCRRDPVDTGLSIFFQNFANSHAYAYDLASIGHYYRQYERIMAHWRAVSPLPMLDVVYEDVVADKHAQARRMIEHLGLPWEDSVAAFEDNRRAIATASVWQARQPIYTRSVERWRKYEPFIGDLLTALGRN